MMTDGDAVCVEDSGGPKEPFIRWRSRSPQVNQQFWEQKEAKPRTCPVVDILKPTLQRAPTVQCRCWLEYTRHGCTLAQPGKYDWTNHVQRPWGILSNYFWPLVSVLLHILQYLCF